jgi:RHS repeat-associated protein
MSKEQQIYQHIYLRQQYQKAYLVYCQQIITLYTAFLWLKEQKIIQKQQKVGKKSNAQITETTALFKKCTPSPKNLNQSKYQENPQLKPLKHKEKLQNKENVALEVSLDAFGNLITQAGSSESPFGFTGYQKDEDTGLYYANARYYDSSLGRFIKEDGSDGQINNPASLHRYLYANANPNSYVDLDGNIPVLNDLANWFRQTGEDAKAISNDLQSSGTTLGKLAAGGVLLLSVPSQLLGEVVGTANTGANITATSAENIKEFTTGSGFGSSFDSVRAENLAFEKGVATTAAVVKERNIGLIPDAFDAVGSTLGRAVAGDPNAFNSVVQGGGAVLLGSAFTRTKFKLPDPETASNSMSKVGLATVTESSASNKLALKIKQNVEISRRARANNSGFKTFAARENLIRKILESSRARRNNNARFRIHSQIENALFGNVITNKNGIVLFSAIDRFNNRNDLLARDFANRNNLGLIGDTVTGKKLNQFDVYDEFVREQKKKLVKNNLTLTVNQKKSFNKISGETLRIWDILSERFVRENIDVESIFGFVDQADPTRIFMQTELPIVLDAGKSITRLRVKEAIEKYQDN